MIWTVTQLQLLYQIISLTLIILFGHLSWGYWTGKLLTSMGTLKTFHTHWGGYALSQESAGLSCSVTVVSSGFCSRDSEEHTGPLYKGKCSTWWAGSGDTITGTHACQMVEDKPFRYSETCHIWLQGQGESVIWQYPLQSIYSQIKTILLVIL